MSYDWKCKVYLNSSSLIQNNEKFSLIEIGMVNLTKEGRYETFLFDSNLEIELNNNILNSFIYSYDKDNRRGGKVTP